MKISITITVNKVVNRRKLQQTLTEFGYRVFNKIFTLNGLKHNVNI